MGDAPNDLFLEKGLRNEIRSPAAQSFRGEFRAAICGDDHEGNTWIRFGEVLHQIQSPHGSEHLIKERDIEMFLPYGCERRGGACQGSDSMPQIQQHIAEQLKNQLFIIYQQNIQGRVHTLLTVFLCAAVIPPPTASVRPFRICCSSTTDSVNAPRSSLRTSW